MTRCSSLLPWHTPVWQLLQQYVAQKRVPQALLISGNTGLGKQQLMQQFANALLCEHPGIDGMACGQCHSCLLFSARTHPDFIQIQPEESGKSIGIDVIRQLLPQLSLKPHFEGYRVVLIASAEHMNTAAANAFLKCLEEPNERTVIILVTLQVARLPATIVSRCQQIKLMLPSRTLAIDWLTQQQVKGNLDALLSLAQGAPLLAMHYAQENYLEIRMRCFAEWQQIAKRQLSPIAVAEQWLSVPFMPLINWLSVWVGDVIKRRYNVQRSHFYDWEESPGLQEEQKQLDLVELFGLYDRLLTMQRQAYTQLNKQLLIEGILIQWLNLNCNE